MKKITIPLLLLIAFSTHARYSSYMGNSYQYDLSDRSDRMEYRMDLDAQLRDRMPSPMRNMDERRGQYGGGIYADY
jgi:hypothetical protein